MADNPYAIGAVWTIDKDQIFLGESITIDTWSTGEYGPYTLYNQDGSKFYDINNNEVSFTSDTYTFTPPLGTYTVYLKVYNEGDSYDSNKKITFTVSKETYGKFIIRKNNQKITLLDENLIQKRLDDKLDTSDAFSGDYTDLTNKPTIPSASSSTPSADISGGAIGSSSNYAKADHQHPLSSAYATSGHNHSGTYAPVNHNQASTTITDMDVVQVVVTYTDNTTETLNLFKKT